MTVEPANPNPCDACPWRTANHGQPHPDGWYTKRNRDRLWAKLRRGESMTCHPTDPTNPLPPGFDPVPEGVTTHECTGALVLQQREIMKAQAVIQNGGSRADYRREEPRGLTIDGLVTVIQRAVVFPGEREMARPDLKAPVSHPPLTWDPDAVRVKD